LKRSLDKKRKARAMREKKKEEIVQGKCLGEGPTAQQKACKEGEDNGRED